MEREEFGDFYREISKLTTDAILNRKVLLELAIRNTIRCAAEDRKRECIIDRSNIRLPLKTGGNDTPSNEEIMPILDALEVEGFEIRRNQPWQLGQQHNVYHKIIWE